MFAKGTAVLLIALMVAPSMFAQDRTVIDHSPLSCVPSFCGHARIAARVIGATPPQTVRVYFRAADQPTEYYIEMLKGSGDAYWAVLPAAAEGTTGIIYRIVARDAAGTETSTATISTPVAAGCQAPVLTGAEKSFASNIAIGLTTDAQTGVPAGFRCTGIQSVIGTNGTLRPNEDCRQVLVANPGEGCDGHPAVVAGRPMSTAQAAGLVAAGAAVGLGVAIIHENNVVNKKPVSSLRP
jgi:hypothetical protein